MRNSQDPTTLMRGETEDRCLPTLRVDLSDGHVPWSGVHLEESGATIHVKGYAFLGETYYHGEGLARWIGKRLGSVSVDDQIRIVQEIIPTLNGSWGLVVHWSGRDALAAVDRSRSVPLFYSHDRCSGVVGSCAEDLSRLLGGHPIDDVAAAELLLSGFISGRRTLYKNVYQIQPGEIVVFRTTDSEVQCAQHRFFDYFPAQMTDEPPEELETQLEQILDGGFARLAPALQGKRVIVPLSGGYDSRLIAWMLKRHGVDDVLCYTYGVADNPQREMARQVAKALGFEWRFIDYNARRWADCINSPQMGGYMRYAWRGTSSPHIQSLPAVMELARSIGLDRDCVFLPGHVSDAWAGAYLAEAMQDHFLHPPSEYHSAPTDLAGCPVTSAIAYHHLNLWPVSAAQWQREPWRSVAERIHNDIAGYRSARGHGPWVYAEWALRSRLACWIVNSCRCFEYFGASFMLPLKTHEIIDFFNRLPAEMEYGNRLYVETLTRKIFGGAHHPLSGIPAQSGGAPIRPSRTKGILIRVLSTMRLYKPLDRVRRSFRQPRGLSVESWFADGRPAERVSIGQALRPYGVPDSLPSDLGQVVRPFLKRPVYSIECNGLLAAVLLAQVYARNQRI